MFVGNSAMVGGGVYAWSNSTVNINGNATFIDNSALDCGGLYVGSSIAMWKSLETPLSQIIQLCLGVVFLPAAL